jgi:pyridinium-3,5-bisthiocarboxylic acid mononucleotide nickel chelatase
MTIAYFDCFSGISGDMTLGALVDAGVDIDALRAELAKLDLRGYELKAEKVTRLGLAATKVHVLLEKKEQPARHLSDIRSIIESSSLSDKVKQKSLAIFERLAVAEAKVHNTTIDKVHFHEVGAVDAIVDIVGSVIGLQQLGITEVIGSPVNVGSGSVHTSHGRLPVPAPATAELLIGVPFYASSISFELTTPTGAAIVTGLSSFFGPVPQMKLQRVAYGAGNKDLPGQPNVLRLLIGEPSGGYEEDSSIIIETNIDDMNPQLYDYVINRLIEAGAHDAYVTPIIMKKGRPGHLLSVLTEQGAVDRVLDVIFRETTSIGVRIHEVGRKKLSREIREVETSYGTVRVKISRRGEEILTVTPEYEDCRKLAEEKNVPLKSIIEESKKAFSRKGAKGAKETKTYDEK